jgi:hypothetical protein
MTQFNEWEKATPEAIRKLILEAAEWPTLFEGSSNLLAARMQTLYLLGVNDGMREASGIVNRIRKEFSPGLASDIIEAIERE